MKIGIRAAIYARISSDPEGTTLGVQRQLEDCRCFLAERGYVIAGEYVDNDTSAFSGAERPEYRRMLDDVAVGAVDAIIVWRIDRLYRRILDLEELVTLAEHGLLIDTVASGTVDLSKADGRLIARLLAAVAQGESDAKSARIKRKMQQKAEQGENRGGPRPYGYNADRITTNPDEAAVIREIATRYLAGESGTSIAHWLNEQGIQSARGKEWGSQTILTIISNPRLAGWNMHNGVRVGRGEWEAILTDEEHARLAARRESQRIRRDRPPRNALLTKVARCGLCGAELVSGGQRHNPYYLCKRRPNSVACGHVAMSGTALDRLITEAVLTRLDSPELAEALAESDKANAGADDAVEALARDRERMEELGRLWANGEIPTAGWKTANAALQQRIETAERRLASQAGTSALVGLPGNGAALRAQWDSLSISRRAAIIRAMLDEVTVRPAAYHGSRDFLARVSPRWRY
jgi:DNA invertase Pin-like site-specific DNA recombinase